MRRAFIEMNDFTEKAKAKGWRMKAIAERWGVSPRRMSQIAAEPKQKDWDAINGLPQMMQWQHDETGRVIDAPESPGPRWCRIEA